MAEIPEYYFRIRDNGAAVFRVESETRHKRLEMTEIAAVNAKNGNIRAHGEVSLTDADRAAIAAWLDDRQQVLARRDAAIPTTCIEQLNLTAQWAQSRASTDALDEATDALLLAMHDLRSVLVRKKASRVSGSD
ncbi:MAG: hypothetical protein AAGF88_07720 [Pseudomonadota bacterium]